MNAKTAKLINRYASVMKFTPRFVKQNYKRLPKRMRFKAKDDMRGKIQEAI